MQPYCPTAASKNVRGSHPYWQYEMHDVLAMLRSLSITTWLLTLSAADYIGLK